MNINRQRIMNHRWASLRVGVARRNGGRARNRIAGRLLGGVSLWMAIAVGSTMAAATTTELDSTSTLSDYVDYAVEHNPVLRSVSNMHEASLSVPDQARALPSPRFSYTYYIQKLETRVGPREHDFMLSQHLPFFGKRGLRGELAQKDADLIGASYRKELLDLVAAVKGAYYEYYRVYHAVRVTVEEKAVLRRVHSVAQVKYASGGVAQQDVLKAQLELSNLEDRLTRLRKELATTTAHLNKLLNRHPTTPLAAPIVEREALVPQSLDALMVEAEANRPELAATMLSLEKAEAARSLAGRAYYPDLMVGFGYSLIGKRENVTLDDNGKDVVQFTAAIDIPIWFGRMRAGVREADARIAWARNNQNAVQTSIQTEIEDARVRVEAATEQLKLYEEIILPQATQTFAASEAGYRTGKVDFLAFLDSQRMLLTLRQTYYRLIADLGKESAGLERALGIGFSEAIE